jgi:very-short-patch-repair endonuclease
MRNPSGSGTAKEAERRARKRAEEQLGAITKPQLRKDGFTDRMIQKRIESGFLVVREPSVYILNGVPPSWEQDLMVACLHAGEGSAASHRSAARLWGISSVDRDVVEITSPKKRVGRRCITYRSILPPHHVRRRHGIPATDPSRTLCDLGRVATADQVETALDLALVKGLTSHAFLLRRLKDHGGKGVRGSGALRSILSSRDPANMPSESVLESHVLGLLRRANLPLPDRQKAIYRDGRFIGRVDFIYPDERLVIEADSVTHHFSRRDWERDLERRNRLTLAGWRVLHVTWFQIKSSSRETVRKIREALSLVVPLPLGL